MVPYTTNDSDPMDVTRAYRTVASVAEDDIIQSAAKELSDKIDGILVTGSDTKELQKMLVSYNALTEEGKAIVGEIRFLQCFCFGLMLAFCLGFFRCFSLRFGFRLCFCLL